MQRDVRLYLDGVFGWRVVCPHLIETQGRLQKAFCGVPSCYTFTYVF